MKRGDYIKAIILDSSSFSFLILTFSYWFRVLVDGITLSPESLQNIPSFRLDILFLNFVQKIPINELLLDLPFLTTYFLATIFLGALVSSILYKTNTETMGSSLFKTKKIGEEIPQNPFTFVNAQKIVVFLVAFIGGVQATELNFYELFSPDGFDGAQRIFLSLFNPNFDILPEAVLKIVETIFMAFMATVLAVPLAFVLSFLAAKNVMSQNNISFLVYSLVRIFINITRSIEPLIWAIIFSVWVGIGPFAGMLALWLHSFVSLAKNFSEIAEGVEEGPIEAIRATGASPLQVVWFGIVPQVVLPYTAFTIYRWDINTRMATVIGLVGGGGIGTLLNLYQGQALWREVGCLVIVIAVAVWIMDTASAFIREALK